MGRETSASEQKGVMQWTGTLLRTVACFLLRSELAMWFVHETLPLSLNYGDLTCFLALLPRSFVLVRCLREAVRCLREANVVIFCEMFTPNCNKVVIEKSKKQIAKSKKLNRN